jgi:hypothetical protein
MLILSGVIAHNLSSLAGDWRRMAAKRRTPIGLSSIPCPIALRFPNISDSGRIVTVRASRVVRSSLEDQTSSWEIHIRMPVILPEERLDSWLSGEAGKEILVPVPADQMKAWPFSARVNSPGSASNSSTTTTFNTDRRNLLHYKSQRLCAAVGCAKLRRGGLSSGPS